MIKTSVKVTRKGPDHLAKLIALTKEIQGAYVTIGVHQGAEDYKGRAVSVAQVALWNEFGTPNAKHPIPERSFLRATMHINKAKIDKWRALGIENMLYKGWSAQQALEMLGFRIQILVQNRIKSNIKPKNAAWTLRDKRARDQGSRTLIATKHLLQSITYRVHLPNQAGPSLNPEATKIV